MYLLQTQKQFSDQSGSAKDINNRHYALRNATGWPQVMLAVYWMVFHPTLMSETVANSHSLLIYVRTPH